MVTAQHVFQNIVLTAENEVYNGKVGDVIKISAMRAFSGDKTIIGNKGNILVERSPDRGRTYHLASIYAALEKEIVLPSKEKIRVQQINDNDEQFLYLYCSAKHLDEGSVWQVDKKDDMKAKQVNIIPGSNFLLSKNGCALAVYRKGDEKERPCAYPCH